LGTFGGTNLPNKVLGTGKVEIASAFGILQFLIALLHILGAMNVLTRTFEKRPIYLQLAFMVREGDIPG
jgi:hypothetical protein